MTALEQKQNLLDEARVAFSENESSEKPAQIFLEAHSWLLHLEINSAGGHTSTLHSFARQRIYREVTLPNLQRPDFVRRELEPSEGWIWELIELEPPGVPLLNRDGSYAMRLNKALAQLRDWQNYADTNNQAMAALLPSFKPPTYGRIIIGRSDQLTTTQRERWRRDRNEYPKIKIRTYTWLLDKIAQTDCDLIQKLERDGSASDRYQLAHDRDFIHALEAKPFDHQFPVNPQGEWGSLLIFAKALRKKLERIETPRIQATHFEALTRAVRPELGDLAKEIRERIHDLDDKEPNIRLDQMLKLLDEFLTKLQA